MSKHTRRAFLNSCLKTPIDPCNNCPAPIYNRPKMCLGRLMTATPLSKASESTKNSERKNRKNPLWPTPDIRSLAKFYESIPEYNELNHLTEEEFYSTLDSLRSTCRELKTKPSLPEESSNTSTNSSNSANKTKKKLKKKNGSVKKDDSKKKSKTGPKTTADKIEMHCYTSTPCSSVLEIPQIKVSLNRQEDFREEVEEFKKTLKSYEEELKNRAISRYFGRAKTFLAKPDSPKSKIDENTQTEPECLNLKPTTPTCLSATSLRKCYSSNDIDSLDQNNKEQLEAEMTRFEKPIDNLTKAEKLAFKDKTRLSNYFPEPITKILSPTTNELPKITVQSPESELPSSKITERSHSFLKKEKRNRKKQTNNIKVPFAIFTLGNNSIKKENIETPSPIHPVARPNLAATLRAEVSRKKLKELQNNCTYNDPTPQFDWEVRKTPAWRLLSLNESHEEILALRLATRRAEQALQQREYELNMELMRQRVKSAPLLLEGSTFWGPNVGKLTHNCQNEGLRHTCDSLKRKQRKKCTAETDQCRFDTRNKLNDLQKIYGSTGKSSSQSRNSQRSVNSTHRRRKTKKNSLPSLDSRPNTLREPTQRSNNDSGDDLCSVDRAFL